MDTRVALKAGTMLGNQSQGFAYRIRKEIARGGSCIVYDAIYQTGDGNEKLVRLKECYPYHLHMQRMDSGFLVPVNEEQSYFEVVKERLRKAFLDGNRLFMTKGLVNATANMLHCFEANNTLYIPTAYMEGETLTADTFSNMKDCVRIVTTIAQVLEQIHQAGYLYLDLKPDNVFVLTNVEGKGMTDLVQLFDFDSLIKWNTVEQREDDPIRLSYTQGFAALEHQMGLVHKLGYYTDVYSVGAILFFLLFGRPPRAAECELDAEYEFANGKYGDVGFQDKLFVRLTDFFHHALASYRMDRYQTMGEAIGVLKEIAELADETTPYLLSSVIIPETQFVGRQDEFAQLEHWFLDKRKPCLFLTGMGGIGKSTVVRNFIAAHEKEVDSVVYLYADRDLKQVITDDFQLQVNTVEQDFEESEEQYFYRKLKAIRKVIHGTRALLVLDDFQGEVTREFLQLLHVGWKVLVISRKDPPSDNHMHIKLRELDTLEEQKHLFENYLGRDLSVEEKTVFVQMAEKIAGHTLVLELLAKQIRNSQLTLEEANELMEEIGFSNLTSNQVRYEKDSETRQGTVRHAISAVFFFHAKQAEQYHMLKMLSLFRQPGVAVRLFCEMLGLESEHLLYELQKEGWIRIAGDMISMHPVIKETVEDWEWKSDQIADVNRIDQYLITRLEEEVDAKKQFPRFQQLYVQRMKRWIFLAEGVLKSSRRHETLQKQREYVELFSLVLLRISLEQEAFLTKYMEEIIRHPLQKGAERILRLYQRWIAVLLEQGEQGQAWEQLEQLKQFVTGKNHLLQAGYYDILGDYYDARLDGAYEETSQEEFVQMRLAMDEMSRHLLMAQEAQEEIPNAQLLIHLLGHANIWMRSMPEAKPVIDLWMEKIEELVTKVEQPYSECYCQYCMTKALYFAFVLREEEVTEELCEIAKELAEIVYATDLERIDVVWIPLGFMMAELGNYKRTKQVLKNAIHICEQYPEERAYRRKKEELEAHIKEVEQLEQLEKEQW